MRSSLQKRGVVALVVVAVLAGIVLYGLPYGRIYQIVSALQADDRQRLVRYIDFAQLKTGLKAQFRAAAPAVGGDLDRMRQAVVAQIFADLVEQMLTPEGMSALFRKNMTDPWDDGGSPPDAYAALKTFLLFMGYADCSYTSSAEFVIVCKYGTGQSLHLFLQRTGLDWRLIRVALERA